MVDEQLAHIYFEAVCGFIMLGGEVYRRRHADRTLQRLPWDAVEDLVCNPNATAESRGARHR